MMVAAMELLRTDHCDQRRIVTRGDARRRQSAAEEQSRRQQAPGTRKAAQARSAAKDGSYLPLAPHPCPQLRKTQKRRGEGAASRPRHPPILPAPSAAAKMPQTAAVTAAVELRKKKRPDISRYRKARRGREIPKA
ncbi:hypothetical protein NDU88_009429 [Pleurodeles waltl]|uniref:Uncharacterized protein n=1 Tax=Pleurodeles waltl TaxID=8319 RepID=A0AAV7QXB5_PLEWA|nr:hypothetical protein NDU88_009429 [Pleurodeles waltl]